MVVNLLTKKPFTRVTPEGYGVEIDVNTTNLFDCRTAKCIQQSDFIREFYPSGHLINSKAYYPDIIKFDEENNKYYEEKVIRVSLPLQMIITIQQLVHLCGNDIKHELTKGQVSESDNTDFIEIQAGWLEKNMEIAFYELAKSVKITGDGAVVFYLKDKKLYHKNLSYLNGDKLYPHYNRITGDLECFARQYSDMDDEGKEVVSYIEVWDKEYMYLYKQDKKGILGTINKVKSIFGLDGYTLLEKSLHGFTEVPIAYKRDDNGACWSFSQDNCDKLELAVSYLCKNNMAYAFPIMVLKGDDISIQGDMSGAVKAITMGKEDDAHLLAKNDSPESFRLQMEFLLKMVFMGGFAVMPPEVKSGDLPGVAIKLIYSPSMDKAIIDAKEFDKTVDTMSRLFRYGYGIEKSKTTRYMKLNIMSWIEPYVHENAAELINNLVQSVNSGILSKSTASTLTHYGQNSEWDKIMKEKKEEDAADLLYTLRDDTDNTTD